MKRKKKEQEENIYKLIFLNFLILYVYIYLLQHFLVELKKK